MYGVIKDSSTGNPLDISAATMTVTWSQDGVHSANVPTSAGSAYGTITKVASHTGNFYVDIVAASNDFYHISMTVASNAANSVSATFDITNIDLSQSTTRATDQTVVRLEQLIRQGFAFTFNSNSINRQTGTYEVYNDAGDAVLYTSGAGGISDNGTIAIRGKLT